MLRYVWLIGKPNYATIHRMIENPIHGGTYASGKSCVAPGYDGRSGIRRKSRDEWLALIPGTHEGYVSWERAGAIRKMMNDNVPTQVGITERPSMATLWLSASFVARGADAS